MQKLRQQVCTITQAKAFLKIGVLQESELYWIFFTNHPTLILETRKRAVSYYDHVALKYLDKSTIEIASAFSCSELGNMLPAECVSQKSEDPPQWICVEKLTGKNFQRTKPHEAWARAAMLLILLKLQYITLAEVNNSIITI